MHTIKFLNAICRRPSGRLALPTRSPCSQPTRKHNQPLDIACTTQHFSSCAISDKNNLDECSTLASNHPAMLSRAVRDTDPKGSSESRPPRHTLTAKQTPSSSRPAATLSSRPSIAGQLKGTTARTPAATASITAESALSRRSINLPGRADPTPTALAGSRKTIASLCHNTSSFDDEPDVFGLFDDEAAAKKEQAKRLATTVYIADDDLSDDDTLDLNFEAPSALPPVPATKSSDVNSAPVASGTTVLSWSQSSDSHFQPPREHKSAPQSVSAKREAPVIDLEAIPPAKKRVIPSGWGQAKTTGDDADGGRVMESSGRVSARRQDKGRLWNAPPSLFKAQQRQFSHQQKRPAATDQVLAEDEIQETVDGHVCAATSKNSPISLSNEQRHVKSLVCDRNLSVFFTGPAGTGKSVLMRAIISDLKKKWAKDPDRLAVTASTGLAACNIGGMTLHSFSGIGLGKEDAQTLVKKIRRNPKAKNRWLRTKILIIDEISMVDGDLFDKLSQIGRIIRNNGRPWGGIQLVITGDFFQLPPVPDGADKRDIKFAFEAATWNTSIDHTIGLTEVFRQKDPEFANMLNEMRLGRISDQTVKKFKALSRPLQFEDGLEVTELFPTRLEVDNSNNRRLTSLQSKPYRFDAVDTGNMVDLKQREKLLQNMMAPKTLELRKGAQVMLIKNMDETLVNGSLGTVTHFMTEASFQAISLGDGYGSGAEDGDGAEDDKKGEARRKRLMAFTRQLEESGSHDNKEYPVVRFHAVDGSPRVLQCVPEEWKSELPTGEVQASRKQVPLILAWALSIHKAQGQTLERVKVDLGRVFEKGQAYVALSRATSQDGLQVLRFEKHKVMAHPRVVEFYNKLYSAETAVSAGRTPTNGAGTGTHGSGPSVRAMSATG